MPDLWDDLPTEMLGDRPPVENLSKQVATPTEVAKKERGKNVEENLRTSFRITRSQIR